MGKLYFLNLVVLLLACQYQKTDTKDKSLEEWIIKNQGRIEKDIQLVIKDYNEREKPDSNWVSASIAFGPHAPISLGELAKKAGDSSECIVVILSFSRDLSKKKEIMITAEDSSCIRRVRSIEFDTDSTKTFIYSVQKETHS